MKILAKLLNYSEPVEVTSIDFKRRTFTWDFRGCLENIESFDDAEFIVPDDSKDIAEIAVKALEWYADKENWNQRRILCSFADSETGDYYVSNIGKDRGKRARQVYTRIKGKQ